MNRLRKIRKAIVFTTVSKKQKQKQTLGRNPAKEMKDIYNENYKTLYEKS
jgi:hypothetical protein